MMDEIDAMVAATQTDMIQSESGQHVHVIKPDPCKKLFPSEKTESEFVEYSNSEFEDENPIPFADYGPTDQTDLNSGAVYEIQKKEFLPTVDSPSESFVTTVVFQSKVQTVCGASSDSDRTWKDSTHNSLPSPDHVCSGTPPNRGPVVSLISPALVSGDNMQCLITPPHKKSPASPMSPDFGHNTRSSVQNSVTPDQRRPVSAISPDLFSPDTPDLVAKLITNKQC
jgi:hypothetical protein